MPKRLHNISRFDGGLNNSADPRDIEDNELSAIVDVMVDKYGKTRNIGSIASSGITAPTATIPSAGYGLGFFSSDYSFGSTLSFSIVSGSIAVGDTITGRTSNATATVVYSYSFVLYLINQDGVFVSETIDADSGGVATITGDTTKPSVSPANMLILQDGADVQLYDDTNSWWLDNILTLGSDTTNVEMLYYVVDGILRVYDANFDNTNNQGQALAYIEGVNRYGNSLIPGSSGWYTGDAEIAPPASSVAEKQIADIINSTTDFPNTAGRVGIALDVDTGTASTEWAGTYDCAMTFIYDGNQESDLVEFGGPSVTVGAYATSIGVMFRCDTTGGFTGNGNIPRRVTAIRIYLRRQGEVDEWWYQGEVDLILGGMMDGQNIIGTWQSVSSITYTYVYLRDNWSDEYTDAPAQIATFKSNTGRDVGDSVDATMKTAVVANRAVYAGNIFQDSKAYGDRILKTPVNKFDLFESARFIDVAVSDADEIVKLEEYADRLLQFKKHKMYLINISQELEFLEEVFPYKGIDHPASSCRTDFGIAWVNELGCYLYDGNSVINLLEKGGLRKIDETTWNTFASQSVVIGYVPKKRQLILTKDVNGSAGDNDIYLYDLVTNSWTTSPDKVPSTDVEKTNAIVDWNGDYLIGYDASSTVAIGKWSDAGILSSNISLETKDIDFGSAGLRKKIYKVYITYTGGTSQNCDVTYQIDGDGNWLQFDANLDSTASGQVIAELTPSASINSAKSIKLKIDGTGAVGFEINDIEIVYRAKSVK